MYIFSENKAGGIEVQKLPGTIDRDELEFEGPPAPICYFIIGGNENNLFNVHPYNHVLTTTRSLDREQQEAHLILIKATENCENSPKNQSFFDPGDDTQLKVIIRVIDVNDNAPKFIHRVFTGGVSTATTFGTTFMEVKVFGENKL